MKCQGGFTLLEMLVAVAVIGLVYAAFAQGLRLGLQTGTRQAVLRADSRGLADGWQVARQALAGMDPGSRARPAVLQARPQRLVFRTMLVWQPGAGQEGQGAPVDAALLLDGRHRLVLRWTRPGTPLSADTPLSQRVLAEGVATLSFAYRRTGATGAWQDSWDGPDLPGLVRLRVAWSDPVRRPWPPVIAAPAATGPGR